ncbi:MAG: hypothetical protein HRT89_17360 [Lentisphaeria bacterium]|nr:hypothetical protein [Lentisphaeria bacterium]NQZ69827.1 hypothetical protein [Lentisphaeria bacterium]
MTNSWRSHPDFQAHFHPEAPDDLQVVVHDGGPRLTENSPESVWVTVTNLENNILTGKVLNIPHQLDSVGEGSEIKFVLTADKFLLLTNKYLDEKINWNIQPCDTCGNTELFDAPSDLIQKLFPDLPDGAAPEMFSSFCGLCGGVQIITDSDTDISDLATTEKSIKKWWQFWKQ